MCAWIETDRITSPVHKAMHKENSYTFTKSTKDIKIINNIILPQYDHCNNHVLIPPYTITKDSFIYCNKYPTTKRKKNSTPY